MLFVLLGVFFFGLGIYGASDPGEASPAVFLLVFGGIGALMLLLAWYIRRRGRVRRGPGYFEISGEPLELRRGDEVEAELRITGPSRVGGEIEVGLVCTEYYDYEKTTTTQHGTSTSRETAEAVAHEQWTPASRSDPVQTFRFRVPEEGPFSHEGAALSFAWRISAREPRRMRSDPASDHPIWVMP